MALPPHVRQARAQQGRKLRTLYRLIGWSRADCAKYLHVSERSLHNWEASRHPVPVAVLRLMRMRCCMALPGKDWDGWHRYGGRLYARISGR